MIDDDDDDYINNLESSLSTRALHIQFEGWYGDHDGVPVNAWTQDTVFFTVSHDGRQTLDSVPRHPTRGSSEVYVE